MKQDSTDADTKRKNKEKLNQLKKRKKEVEEEILNEIKKLAPEKLKNLQFPPDHGRIITPFY